MSFRNGWREFTKEFWSETTWAERLKFLALSPLLLFLTALIARSIPQPYGCPECDAEHISQYDNCPECGHGFTATGKRRQERGVFDDSY